MRTVLSCAALPLLSVRILAADWPEFRGPTGQGHSAETDLPIAWGERRNIAWKVPIAGRGWSSPVLLGPRVWITTATDGDRSLRAVALDRESGRAVHDIEIFRLDSKPRLHSKNTPASPTPLLEPGRVYVHFGSLGTACLSADDGKVLWRTRELKFEHGHGPGGSPASFKDLLIINCDGNDRQFVVGLEKETGRVRWRSDREGRMAYSTPLVIRAAGVDQVVSTGGDRVISYDPATGREIWRSEYSGGYSLVPRPIFGGGLVFVVSGYDRPVLYAIRPEGKGDVTATHVAWKLDRGAPHNPSPLLVGDRLLVLSDRGILTCLQAATGEEVWRQRLEGDYSASPVHAGGRIYLQSEEGDTTVIEAEGRYRQLAMNRLEGRTLASLAVSDGAIFIRSDRHLYRIGRTKKP